MRQEHLARFIDVLNQLPKSYRKSPKDRLKTLAQILDAAQGKPVGVSPTTINRNIDYIGQLLKKARSEGFASVVMLDPGSLRERKSRRDRDQRPVFTLEDIGKIFSHPIWHGWKSKRHWQEPGPNLIRDGLFWVPMIAALSCIWTKAMCISTFSPSTRPIQSWTPTNFMSANAQPPAGAIATTAMSSPRCQNRN